MKVFATISALLFLGLASSLGAETNSLILTGEGKNDISDEMILHTRQSARSVSGDAGELWMLDCYRTEYDGPRVSHTVEVYFTPLVSSARFLRGKNVRCMDGNQTDFGGWYSCDNKPRGFGIIAPLDQSFSTNGPPGKPFAIVGDLPDADVITLFDEAQLAVSNQRIINIQLITATRASVDTWGLSGRYGFSIDFEKTSGIWKEIRRQKMVQ